MKTLAIKTTCLFLTCTTLPLMAVDQTWMDTSADNTWNTSSLNWDADAVWTQGNSAIFGGLGETVTLGEPISIAGLTLNASGYSIEGTATNKLTLAATTGFITANASGTITAPIAIGATPTVTVATGNQLSLSGIISGAAGGSYTTVYNPGFKKMGLGTLVMSGANTYTGLTIVEEGTIRANSNTAMGTLGTPSGNYVVIRNGAAVELDSGYGTSVKRFHLEGTGINGNGAIRNISGNNTLSGNNYLTGLTRMQSDAGMLTIDGRLNTNINGASRTSALHIGGDGDVTIKSVDATVMSLTKNGKGNLYVSGVVNVMTHLYMQEGVLQLTGTMPSTGRWYIGKVGGVGCKVILGNSTAKKDQTIGELGSYGPGTNRAIVGGNSAPSTLTVNLTTGTNTYSGDLGGSGTDENALALTKSGAGTLVLEGENSYFGNTVVNAGTLSLASTGRLNFYIQDTTSNTLSGVGNAVIDGKFVMHLDAVTVTTGSWVLENVDTLTGAYSDMFECVTPAGVPWTDAGSNRWTHTEGTRLYTFDETTGTLTLEVAASGYPTWANANAPGQTPDADHDGDGVANGIEYFMGETGSGITVNPSLDANHSITWTKSDQYSGTYGSDYWVETSTDLTTWTPVASADVIFAPGKVQYNLPQGSPKSFVRLRVVIP